MLTDQDLRHTCVNFAFGMASASVGAIASIANIEQTLRVFLLLLSVALTSLSLVNAVLAAMRRWKGRLPVSTQAEPAPTNHKDPPAAGGVSLPWVCLLAAILLSMAMLASCSKSDGRLVGADGIEYVRVHKGKAVVPGRIGEVDLWQRVGAIGTGKRVYLRTLQTSGDTLPPTFIGSGVLP